MPTAIRSDLLRLNRRNMLSKHGWKGVVAVTVVFFAYAAWHLFFPDVQALQEKVAAEQEKMRTGQSKWRFGYADGSLYSCEDTGIPFGHIIRLCPDGDVKAVFPTFFGVFIGRGYLCGARGKIIGVYWTLSPKCVESDYLESQPPPPPPKQRSK
ncbi:MAG: hypothetical protein FWG50_01420 [Kiritimatiellaeota bacterium]|nr:hypothetical protein [Kiritimatiellota bacterium]